MKKWSLMSGLLLAVCVAQTCSINVDVGGKDPLDEVDGVIIISRIAGNPTATVSASIRRGFVGVQLEDDQDVMVNGESLQSAGGSGAYGAVVDAAGQYTVTVREPTRGIEDTTIAEPDDFDITSPVGGNASLSGFTLAWTNADASFQVEVELEQNLLDEKLELELQPFADTGSVDISSSDLQDAGFGQGADLIVTITKINERNGINGFSQGTLRSRLTKSAIFTPGP